MEEVKVCTSCYPLIGETIEEKSLEMSLVSKNINEIGKAHSYEEMSKVNEYIEKHRSLIEKRDELANSITTSNLIIERADSLLFKEQIELDELN